jgi:hypothetical protein
MYRTNVDKEIGGHKKDSRALKNRFFVGLCFLSDTALALCIVFVDRCLSFCDFSFSHGVVCSSSI